MSKFINFRVNDKIQIQNKSNLVWYDAVITEVGKTESGNHWARYDLTPAVHGGMGIFAWVWKDGIYQEELDPKQETIRLIERYRKFYRMLYNEKDSYHYLEEIK